MQALHSDSPHLYPFVFKNSGAEAGATLEHAHSQMIAMPRVPLAVDEEMNGALRYTVHVGRCIYCDVVQRELAGPRALLQTANFAAFLPYAGRFPCEICILPKTHASHYETITDLETMELATVLRGALRRLDVGLDHPPYNYFIHTAPLNEPPLPHYHWHIEILPRITGVAGFELGTGFTINPVPPEQAAEYLRGIKDL